MALRVTNVRGGRGRDLGSTRDERFLGGRRDDVVRDPFVE